MSSCIIWGIRSLSMYTSAIFYCLTYTLTDILILVYWGYSWLCRSQVHVSLHWHPTRMQTISLDRPTEYWPPLFLSPFILSKMELPLLAFVSQTLCSSMLPSALLYLSIKRIGQSPDFPSVSAQEEHGDACRFLRDNFECNFRVQMVRFICICSIEYHHQWV